MKKIYMLAHATKHSGANHALQKQNLLRIVKTIRENRQHNSQIKMSLKTDDIDAIPPKLEIEISVEEDGVSKILDMLEDAAHSSAADSYILVVPDTAIHHSASRRDGRKPPKHLESDEG